MKACIFLDDDVFRTELPDGSPASCAVVLDGLEDDGFFERERQGRISAARTLVNSEHYIHLPIAMPISHAGNTRDVQYFLPEDLS